MHGVDLPQDLPAVVVEMTDIEILKSDIYCLCASREGRQCNTLVAAYTSWLGTACKKVRREENSRTAWGKYTARQRGKYKSTVGKVHSFYTPIVVLDRRSSFLLYVPVFSPPSF
jgi:hypothetical protein